jgi:peroxiredoxin Q/BCP
MNTEVLGISVDNWPTHTAFRKSLDLPFDLLSDWSREVSKEYGAFDETEMTSTRRSFLIDKEGKIVFTQEADLNTARDHGAMMKAIEDLNKKGG